MRYILLSILIVLEIASGQQSDVFIHGENFSLDCNLCHNTESWKVEAQKVSFDHNSTGYSLIGTHRSVNCRGCHKSLVFSHIGHNCNDCHQDIHQGKLGFNCNRCHTPASWENRFEIFAIHQKTRFPLYGIHATLDCQSCHDREDRQDFKLKGVECRECHLQDFLKSVNPSHQKAQFSLDCKECHSISGASWNQAIYEHSEQFALVGGHSRVECIDCHSEQYSGLSLECYSCHQPDYDNTTDPDHQASNFPLTCEDCHTTNGWSPATFDHNQTNFPLRGAHQNVKCNDCHANNQLLGLPRDCYGCHQDDYNQVEDNGHVEGNFPHDCLVCHNQEVWSPANFDHDITAFPLTGAHQTLFCESCHPNALYTAIPTYCYFCHETDFNQVADPDHQQNNFSHDCEICHSITGWSPATFDHTQTNFPLTGAHQNAECLDCHQNGYQSTPTECVSCHLQDYNNTTDPDHQVVNFPLTCEDCHTTNGWSPATFDHNQTNFPLRGAHQNVKCTDCHVNNQFLGLPRDCFGCHQDDYNQVGDPGHVEGNFPHDCLICHNQEVWSPANFDHDITAFPLTGAHQTLFCESCHPNALYTAIPTYCYFCHETDFNQVADPDHQQNNFSHDCEICHSTTDWSPATFDHNQTNFPLTGAHQNAECLDCHQNGYQNTSTECVSCHQQDYDNTTDPDHQAANFPLTCEDCHTTNGWSPANWDHDSQYFPIYSGEHKGEWNTCADCHVNSSDYSQFECINCHEHSQNKMDDEHQGVQGYIYNSDACYSCHPQGEGD